MSHFFLELLKLSISASFLIVAVILLRLLMRKSPKSFYCILWALVGIRLICPFSFESRFSVIPKEEVIPIHTILSVPTTQTEFEITNTSNDTPSEVVFELENTIAPSKTFRPVDILSIIWLAGTIGIMLYGIISYFRLKRIVSVSINDKENIYLCDHIDVPFIFGIFKPKIYLPSNLADNQKEYVLLHEKAHLSRHDNLWKPLGFILLSIYWFNPLVWIAYHLFSKDIELATDEKVIHHLNHDEIKGYSETLLACSLIKSNLMIKTCPVAFGEVGVKDRIKAVLNYKKPSFWIILITIISCIVVAVCFLTKQKDDKIDAFTQDIDEVLKKKNDVSNQVPISQFQNIMGYDTYYIDTENAPHFYTRDYYTKYDDKEYLIAESYGFEKEREDTIKDLNGDGYTELICNCVSGGDGHQEVYIFMKDLSSSTNGPSVMRCNIDYEKMNLKDFFNWGINAFSTRYEPSNRRFAITYSKGNAEKTEDATIYINDTEIMDKLNYRKHIVEIQTNNNSIELKTYEAENDVSYTLSDSDSSIIKNIISNGKWNKETCDGLPEYTFVLDNRKYGIEIFSSQIHITDMSGKGEIVCTDDEFNTLKSIIELIKPRNSENPNGVESNKVTIKNGPNDYDSINVGRIESFIENSNNGVEDEIEITQFTIEGDPIVTTVRFNAIDGTFELIKDNTQDKFGKPEIIKKEYNSSYKAELAEAKPNKELNKQYYKFSLISENNTEEVICTFSY